MKKKASANFHWSHLSSNFVNFEIFVNKNHIIFNDIYRKNIIRILIILVNIPKIKGQLEYRRSFISAQV